MAEKPSVARDLARVLGLSGRRDGLIEGQVDGSQVVVTWCLGHLVELEDPVAYDPAWKAWRLDRLPMLPDAFRLRPRAPRPAEEGRRATDQWPVVRELLCRRDVRQVVNACDAGREGELIFRHVVELAGCRAPVVRFWTSSLTDEAIRLAWQRLRPAHAWDALGDAARCRAEADWLVGLNATRAMTCLARDAGAEGRVLSVGRVQTPTLAMIVARDRAIEAFVPEPFWTVKAAFVSGQARWQARWFHPGVADDAAAPPPGDADAPAPVTERLASSELAEAVAAAARGAHGVVRTSGRTQVRERAPQLYDLTALQRRANQRYGLSAARTLEVAQALYERHKLITYPRTDARTITPDQVPELPGILRGLATFGPYAEPAGYLLGRPDLLTPGKRVVDASEVGDHHAILPTGRHPDANALDADARRVFDLVARRFLAALHPDAVFASTKLVVEVPCQAGAVLEPCLAPGAGGRHALHFRASGRVRLQAGWQEVDPPPRRVERDLPDVPDGAGATAEAAEVEAGHTRPPRPHDDASLLKAMETAGKDLDDAELRRAMKAGGLGTPATRAAIIQTLLQRSYVEREGRTLRATADGRALIDALPVEALRSAELTGRWEARLHAMAEGQERRDRFMADIRAWTAEVVAQIAAAPAPSIAAVHNDATPLGACPLCHQPVRQVGGGAAVRFACDSGRACGFVVWGTMSRRSISPRMVRSLLVEGRTPAVKGFRSKAGKAFEAGLQLEDGGKVGFWFPERDVSDAGAPARPAAGHRVLRGTPAASPAAPAGAGAVADRVAPEAGRRRSVRATPEAERSAARGGGGAAQRVRPGAAGASGRAQRAPGAGRTEPPQHPVPAGHAPPRPGDPCPVCGVGEVIRGRMALGCDRWREGCPGRWEG